MRTNPTTEIFTFLLKQGTSSLDRQKGPFVLSEAAKNPEEHSGGNPPVGHSGALSARECYPFGRAAGSQDSLLEKQEDFQTFLF